MKTKYYYVGSVYYFDVKISREKISQRKYQFNWLYYYYYTINIFFIFYTCAMPSRAWNQFNNLITGKNLASSPHKMREYYKNNVRWILEGNLLNKETILGKLDITNRNFTNLYNNSVGKLSIEQTVLFIKWLQYYLNQKWTIVFTGWFDYDLEDVLSGDVTDLKIEDGKVKVSFTLDDGTPRTDEVELKDAFCPDFSFHCK